MTIPSSNDVAFNRKLNEIIHANLENEHFGVRELAREIGMSRFNLNRKLHFIHQKTINQYIREVRLQKAMELLVQESVTASEVAFKVGFSSPAYFSTCFSEYYGYPPGEARKRSLFGLEENHEEPTLKSSDSKLDSRQTGTESPELKKQGRLIAIVAIFIILIIAIIYFVSIKFPEGFDFVSKKWVQNQKKTIAVLPFINDSKDPENVYFINGVMEAILDNISKIKDLEVRPRTSVEQYRNIKTKTIPEIAGELGVNYIIEGSGQKIGDQVILTIQLIEASSDKHLFSIRKRMKLEDIFDLQSEVAIRVASELAAVISVGEKELIEKPPTTSIAAWEMYSRGLELHNIADLENNIENDKQAKVFFKKAIQLDSTYAESYVQLGWICCYASDQSDSALYYANKALHFDNKNSGAHCLRGFLFYESGMNKKAEDAFNLAIQYNPNCSLAYDFLADMSYNQGDSYKAIKNKLKALKLENNPIEKRYNLISLWDSFNNVGIYEEAKKYGEKLIILTGDSTYYYWTMLQLNSNLGNSASVVSYAHKIYNTDSLNLGKLLSFHHSYFLGNTYVNLRDYKEAYRVLEKYTASMKQQGRIIDPDHYFGFIYLKNGRKAEAKYHLEGSIKIRLYFIDLNKPTKKSPPNLGLTYIYAGLGNKAKALEYIRVVNNCPPFLYTCSQIALFKISPMVDCIRKEPEYLEFLKNAEARYQEEHNQVEKLLSAEGILNASL